MRRSIAIASTIMACGVVTVATLAIAQNAPMHHHGSMTASPPDSRQMVQFPPDMQTNFLGNMRDHMQTLDGMLEALAKNDYAAASKIAAERLGLDSPSAAGCKPKPAAQVTERPAAPPNHSSKPMTMDEMMEAYMPEAMRGIGLSMHTAASEFAKIAESRDRDATLTALSHVTQNCVACHSTYRLR